MDGPNLFWTIFAAVLGALMLAGTFFWGMVAYTRLEKEGRETGKDGTAPLVAVLMPIGFLALAFYLTMGT